MKANVGRRRLLGGAVAAALAPRGGAQDGRRLGIVEYGAPPDSALSRVFLESLAALGWREGASLQVERRHALGQPERMGELLRELAARPVDLLFAPGHDVAKAAVQAAPALRVVTAGSEDPVRSGLIRSFAHPGGNVTGVSFMSPELAGKRLELLRDMVPGLSRVAALRQPAHADTYYDELAKVGQGMGLKLALSTLDSAADFDRAFGEIERSRAQALFVVPSRLTNLHSQRIVEFALRARLPTMSAYDSFVEAGGLMTYGADSAELLRRAAAQADRLLRGGARPEELPFELPARYLLAVNLRTARALGLALPPAIVLRAERVIE